MGDEIMGLQELAHLLRRDLRDVSRWASRGYVPGQKVSGEWRFHRAEINHWIETQMHAYTEDELRALEAGNNRGEDEGPLLANLLMPKTVAVPLTASTRASVLRQLVALAEQSWHVYDPESVLDAIQRREEMGSTGVATGVAIPHPRRPLPHALGESVVAFGRSGGGIPFGESSGKLTDLFFLVCCRDDRTHLSVLARLSRLMLRPQFLEEFTAETSDEAYRIITEAEGDLTG